jgi:hypothetical protein
MNRKTRANGDLPSLRPADLMRLAAEDIDSASLAIPGNFARAKFDLAAWNASDVVRRYLERAALLLRSGGDSGRVRAELEAALAYVAHVEEAVRRCEKRAPNPRNFVHAMNLIWPMLVLMLLNDWDRLSTLERLAQSPIIQEEGLDADSGGVDDTIVKMLLALLAEDAAAFERARTRFDGARSIDRYYQRYFAYDGLMSCLLARDEPGLARCLEQLDLLFRERANDPQLVQLPLLGAAGPDNGLVVDVWAWSLAQLAKRSGMAVGFSSEVIPVNALPSPR